MSTPLSTMQTQIRRRVGFEANTDGPLDDGDRILDEQEQDQVIDDIRHQMVKSDREYQVGIGVMALLSCVLHVIYLFNPLRSPTSVLFTAPHVNSPIPLNTMFTYLHLCLQGYLCFSVFYPLIHCEICTYLSFVRSNVPILTGRGPPIDLHLFPALLLSSIAPILCIVLRKDWADLTWWCFCGILFLVYFFVRRGTLRDEARIEGLEKLKYHAKGA